MRREATSAAAGDGVATGGATVTREVHLDQWVDPTMADERGELRAGRILEWMDVVGVLAATRHSRCPVVTASVDGMDFRESVKVGERITMTATVGFTSAKSLGVSVSMVAGFTGARERRCFDGYMTFVALDAEGRPSLVPQLTPETPNEVARFREGQLRREFRRKLDAGELHAAPSLASIDARDRPFLIRELLKVLPMSFRLPWEPDIKPRRRHASYMHSIELARTGHLNFHGTLYGGTLMRWLENTASLSARAHVGGLTVRMSGLQGLSFIRPVPANCFVHVRSEVVHATSEGMTVLVNVHAEDPMSGALSETVRAFITYCPTDGASVRVPPLELTNDEDRALHEEVEHRLSLQRVIGGEGVAA
ncbi:MAG: acyl-CoA thioesterase [Polyangiaceae bacterium]